MRRKLGGSVFNVSIRTNFEGKNHTFERETCRFIFFVEKQNTCSNRKRVVFSLYFCRNPHWSFGGRCCSSDFGYWCVQSHESVSIFLKTGGDMVRTTASSKNERLCTKLCLPRRSNMVLARHPSTTKCMSNLFDFM